MTTKRINLTGLRPHEHQLRIYGDEATDQDLVASIREVGLLEKIVILPDGRIISGHRRWKAALAADLVFIDVIVRDDLDEDYQQTQAIVEYNRQRLKTEYQIGQEMKALLYVEREAAKRRQQATQFGESVVEIFPPPEAGKARDKVGEHFGKSGRTVERQVAVVEAIETFEEQGQQEKADAVRTALNNKSVAAAQREIKTATSSPVYYTAEAWERLAPDERRCLVETPPPSSSSFNATNDMVDWARWTWNPVTGCLHNCPYCYARDIATRFYEQGFAPVFHPGRLRAPENTAPPRQAGPYQNVFTGSMSDLFGRWVPQDWIDAVLDRMRTYDLWTYLVLTKFPQRLSEQDWPANTWVGATVDTQDRVDLTMKAFRRVKEAGRAGVTWLSLEPLLEPLRFDSLEMFDMIVIGGASKSTKTPEWFPPVRWVIDLMDQADREGVRVYLKENAVKELPNRPAASGVDRAPDAFFQR